MRKMKTRIAAVVLGLMTALAAVPMTGLAAGSIDTGRECELVIQYDHDDKALSNVEFDLYRVADVDEYARLTLTEEFEQYPVDIGSYKGEAWNELASTLDGYIARDAQKPEGPKEADSGVTDENGTLKFPNQQDSMKAGLYLVIGETVQRGDYRYTCDPAIILLPQEDAVDNDWVYGVSMHPKSSEKYDPDEDPDDDPVVTKVSRNVIKSWNDSGFEADRPNSVEVTLLKNGEPYETVSLNAGNNWKYTWNNLDKSASWKVTEDVPIGYSVSVTRQGNTFVVKNTKLPVEVITDPEPPATDDPTGVLGEMEILDPMGVLGAMDMLPQTGTTWWLAAALAGAGIMLVVFGLFLRKKA